MIPAFLNSRRLGLACAALALGLPLLGAADGSWLRRVPAADHARPSPFATSAQLEPAAAAGAHLFHAECAKCHGDDGLGRGSRPPVISDRVAHSSDGDLFWLMTNGNPWRGMPPWNMLPAGQRWQLVAYVRGLNSGEAAEPQPSAQPRPSAEPQPSAQPQGAGK